MFDRHKSASIELEKIEKPTELETGKMKEVGDERMTLFVHFVTQSNITMMANNKNSSEEKINSLIEIAFKKGIEKAVKEARKLNNPYILDEFHDRLVEELKERKAE